MYRSQFPSFKNKLSPTLYVSLLIVFLYLNNFGYLYLQLLIYFAFLVKDFKNVKSILDSESLEQ